METETHTETLTLLDLIKDQIRALGPMTLADYMALALSHPTLGYYMRKDPLGTQGDFTTAPEISQIFGELIGLWLAQQWRTMGSPPAALVELGPGRGTLMADMLRATQSISGFHDAVSVHLVETSPALRQKQWHALAGKHPSIEWHPAFSDMPEGPMLLVANEFFDALPIRQFTRSGSTWQERFVALDEHDHLQFVWRPANPPPSVRLHLAARDKICEYSPAVEHTGRQIASHIDMYGGAALLIDYGYAGGARYGDTLQAVRSHRYHDVLAEPGTADITAHVNFDLLRQTASLANLAVHGPVQQGLFLSKLGAHLRAARLCQSAGGDQKRTIIAGLDRLISLDQMGDLFKVMAITPAGHPTPDGF